MKMTEMEPRVESLSGWWHVYFEVDQNESISPYHRPANEPRGGWSILEDHKQSVPVPGTWHERVPGFKGTAWYWRPFVLPDEWCSGRMTLVIVCIRSRAKVYLDGNLVGQCHEPDRPCQVELGSLERNRVYHLALSVWHDDDSGGITGPVTLLEDAETA